MELKPQLVHSNGDALRVALYRVLNASSGDTIDVGEHFRKVTAAYIMPASVAIPNFPPYPPAQGAVLTIEQVGLANEAIYLLVKGAAAS